MARRINVRLGFDPAKLPKVLELTAQEASVATKACDAVFRSYERELFATNGAIGGPEWKPNSFRYMLWKASKGFHRTPLVLTGKLRNSLLSPVDGQHVHQTVLEQNGKWTARLGTSNPNAVKNAVTHVSKLPPYLVPVYGRQEIEVPGRNAIQGAERQTSLYVKAMQAALIPLILRRFAGLTGGGRLTARRGA